MAHHGWGAVRKRGPNGCISWRTAIYFFVEWWGEMMMKFCFEATEMVS